MKHSLSRVLPQHYKKSDVFQKPMHILALLVSYFVYAQSISFNHDYTLSTSAPLKVGQAVTVYYDMARATCPDSFMGGYNTKAVFLYYVFNGNFKSTSNATIYDGRHLIAPTISLLETGDLAMWILCTSNSGSSYDSNFGNNWRTKII